MAYIETSEVILGVYGKARLVYTLGTLDPITNKVPVTLEGRFYYKYPEYTSQKELQGDGGTFKGYELRAYINGTLMTTWASRYTLSPVTQTSYYYYYYIDLGTFYVTNPNTDGSDFTFTLEVRADMGCSPATNASISSYTTKTASTTVSVGGVERKAILTVPQNCTVGTTATLSYAPVISGYTYELTYSINGHTGNASTSWTIPQFANTDSTTGTLTLKTKSNGTVIGTDTKTFNYIVPSNYLPTISFDFSYSNLNGGRVLAGQSSYSTTISTSSVPSGNIATTTYTYSLNSPANNTLTKSGNVLTCSTLNAITQSYQDTLTITATDSRGRVATLTKSTASILSYLVPQITWLELYRTSTKTSAYIKLSITDIQGTISTKSVTATSGSSTVSGTLTSRGNNIYDCTLTNLSVSKQWTIKVSFKTSVMTSHSIPTIELTQQLSSTQVPISLYDDGSSVGVAFGMYSQGGGVEFAEGLTLKGNKNGTSVSKDAYDVINGLTASDILDLIYPVGSIYMSVNNVSPQTFIGGTWTKIENTFLLSSGTRTLGSTGGASEHTLSVDELPPHYHRLNRSYNATNNALARIGLAGSSGGTQYGFRSEGVEEGVNDRTTGATPFSIMPPYLVVNMWKRIS